MFGDNKPLGKKEFLKTVKPVKIGAVISLIPDLSNVLIKGYKLINRFNGFPGIFSA